MKRLVVGAAIVDDLQAPTRVLAARRTYPPELAGAWEFPGGKVEPGETPHDALAREVREELGVDLRIGAEVPNPDPGPWPLTDALDMRVFLCTASDEPQPGAAAEPDHDEVRWLDADRLDSVAWLPGDRPIAAALRSILMLLG